MNVQIQTVHFDADSRLLEHVNAKIEKLKTFHDKIIGLALNDSDFEDFEDGLQYFTAIENGQDCIITRNLKDYKKSRIPVMNAEQYLKTL